MDELLALVEIHLRIVAGEAVARPADGEPLFVQQLRIWRMTSTSCR